MRRGRREGNEVLEGREKEGGMGVRFRSKRRGYRGDGK